MNPLLLIQQLLCTKTKRYKKQYIRGAQTPNQEGQTHLELYLHKSLVFTICATDRGSPTSKQREDLVRWHMQRILTLLKKNALLFPMDIAAMGIPTGTMMGFPGILHL